MLRTKNKPLLSGRPEGDRKKEGTHVKL